jgi:glycerol-3-phosphate cytidylyltransferase
MLENTPFSVLVMGLGRAKPWNKVRSFNSNYSVIMSVKQKVGITFSAFDLLHAGHITMLEEAKRQCDYLICGLQTDPTIDRPEKNRPVQSVVERYIQLKGCKFVDEIVPYATEQDLEDILRAFKIDVRIIGDEYQHKNFTGRTYCEEKGIELCFNIREHRFSSSSLRQEVADKQPKK